MQPVWQIAGMHRRPIEPPSTATACAIMLCFGLQMHRLAA